MYVSRLNRQLPMVILKPNYIGGVDYTRCFSLFDFLSFPKPYLIFHTVFRLSCPISIQTDPAQYQVSVLAKIQSMHRSVCSSRVMDAGCQEVHASVFLHYWCGQESDRLNLWLPLHPRRHYHREDQV